MTLMLGGCGECCRGDGVNKVEVPEASSRVPFTGKDNVIVVADSNNFGIKSDFTPRITELANRNEGECAESRYNMGTASSKW
jgi:hypothetical protein